MILWLRKRREAADAKETCPAARYSAFVEFKKLPVKKRTPVLSSVCAGARCSNVREARLTRMAVYTVWNLSRGLDLEEMSVTEVRQLWWSVHRKSGY